MQLSTFKPRDGEIAKVFPSCVAVCLINESLRELIHIIITVNSSRCILLLKSLIKNILFYSEQSNRPTTNNQKHHCYKIIKLNLIHQITDILLPGKNMNSAHVKPPQ